MTAATAGLLERAQVLWRLQGLDLSEFCQPRPIQFRAVMTNWITRFSRLDPRPSRFEATPDHWRQFEVDLQRWGGTASSWRRLEQLGQVAKTGQTE